MRPRRGRHRRLLADQDKSGAFGTGSWTGHTTPCWVLQSAARRSWLTCSRGVS
jgi:hypothetical protein